MIEIYSSNITVICPKCSYELEGFVSDPRGTEVTCDSCKKKFKIPYNAKIILR